MRIISYDELGLNCIDDCSGPGPADDAVDYWYEQRATVFKDFEMGEMIDYLLSTGGYQIEELDGMTVQDLGKRILWLACCHMREGEDFFVMES